VTNSNVTIKRLSCTTPHQTLGVQLQPDCHRIYPTGYSCQPHSKSVHNGVPEHLQRPHGVWTH
jgi:hypothetical protein